MTRMYICDTSIFISLGLYYPSRFPTIWKRINELADAEMLLSTREVRRELENICPHEHVNNWIKQYQNIFLIPTNEECETVVRIFQKEQYRGLVRRQNILKGWPVADPFVVALAKAKDGYVVTQELYKSGGARIPTVCKDLDIECLNLEGLLEKEKLKY
jgi:hypothetical protein